jgi:S-formylglutathione hydrolase FrmB
MGSMPMSLVVEFWRVPRTLKSAIVPRRLTAAILPAALPALTATVGFVPMARAATPESLQVSSPGQVIDQTVLQNDPAFRDVYSSAGGHNATFNIDINGVHRWGYWGAQLAAMKGDMQSTLGAGRSIAS